MILAKENDAHVDDENGCIPDPRESDPESISVRTLNEMDHAVRNFELGNVADPTDPTDF